MCEGVCDGVNVCGVIWVVVFGFYFVAFIW